VVKGFALAIQFVILRLAMLAQYFGERLRRLRGSGFHLCILPSNF
jgi:hypothetical protein